METIRASFNSTLVRLKVRCATAAPEMLDFLEEVWHSDVLSGDGNIRIKALIKKARGE